MDKDKIFSLCSKVGPILVVVSMLMPDMLWLRIINSIGCVFAAIGLIPIWKSQAAMIFMNVALIAINMYYLVIDYIMPALG